MKNMKGFTLIELLAVIVILAVIILIALPMLLNTIDEARRGAFKDSSYGILDAVEFMYANVVLDERSFSETTISYDEGIESFDNYDGLNYTGSKPEKGQLIINSEGLVKLDLYDGKFCARKGFSETKITVSETSEGECIDLEAPVITLLGDATVDLAKGDVYTEPGFMATDDVDGDLSSIVSIEGDVNTNIPGTYTVTYSVIDAFGNEAVAASRTVVIADVFTKVIGGSSQEQIYDIVELNDGSFVTSMSMFSNDGDLAGISGAVYGLVKLSATGDIIDIKKSPYGSYNFKLDKALDGNLIVANDTSFYKLNTSFNLIQSGSIPRPSGCSNFKLEDFMIDSSGNMIFIGYSTETGTHGHNSNNGCIISVNSSGSYNWGRTIDVDNGLISNGSVGVNFRNIIESSPGNYVIVGHRYVVDYLGSSAGSSGIIYTYNSAGTGGFQSYIKDSRTCYNTTSCSSYESVILRGITKVSDGYIVGAFSTMQNSSYLVQNGSSIPSSFSSNANGDMLFIKLNNSFSATSAVKIGGSYKDDISSLITASDGTVFVSGTTNSNNGDFTINKWPYEGAALIKLNSNLAKVWINTYSGSNSTKGIKALELSDGGIILSGDTQVNDYDFAGLAKGSWDAFFIKTDKNGK